MLCKRLQTMRDIHDQFSCEDKCSLIYLLVVFPSQFVNIYKLIKLKCNDTRTKIRRIFFFQLSGLENSQNAQIRNISLIFHCFYVIVGMALQKPDIPPKIIFQVFPEPRYLLFMRLQRG